MTSIQIGDLHLGLFLCKAKDKCIYMYIAQKGKVKSQNPKLNHMTYNKGQVVYHSKDQVIYHSKDQVVYHSKDQVVYHSKGQVVYQGKGSVGDNNNRHMLDKSRHFSRQRDNHMISNHSHLVQDSHSRYCLYFTEVKMKLYVEILNGNLYFTFVYFYLGNCFSSKK